MAAYQKPSHSRCVVGQWLAGVTGFRAVSITAFISLIPEQSVHFDCSLSISDPEEALKTYRQAWFRQPKSIAMCVTSSLACGLLFGSLFFSNE